MFYMLQCCDVSILRVEVKASGSEVGTRLRASDKTQWCLRTLGSYVVLQFVCCAQAKCLFNERELIGE